MEVYSINGEDNWTKDIDDIICGLNEDGQLGEIEITKGESIIPTHKEFVDTDILMEFIAGRAYDEYGDHTDTYLDDVDSEKKEELKKVIANWLDDNTKKPDFYGVENIEKTTVFIEDKTTKNQQLQVGQIDNPVIQIINALRESDPHIKTIYTEGGCYKFHLFLKNIYKDAIAVTNDNADHIGSLINGEVYDINGKINWSWRAMSYEEIEEAEKWTFAGNKFLQIGECPVCEEPIVV